jgi:hypothetical protein
VDVAPAVVAAIAGFVPAWLNGQREVMRRVDRFYDRLQPAAVFMNHEGNRTPWVAAAKRRGIPVVAVQHGVIFPAHAVYQHPRLETLPLPDVTCVFGPYERDVLLNHGGYLPAEVSVTGSPRPGQESRTDMAPEALAREREAVRRELGVTPDERLLVVSSANIWIVRDVHIVEMVARTLGGPLPGIHVVIKQHPGEADEGPFRELLEGLARTGGYSPPRLTVVREIDLYRLLRAADAHLGLHSTVLTDAALAGTPNLISVGQAYGDLLGYVDAGVARPVRNVADVVEAMRDPRPARPADRAAFVERHFLAGDGAQRIAAIIETLADEPGH